MDLTGFKQTLSDDSPPPGLSPALTALWFARNENWERAHEIVQDKVTVDCAWVHAYVHRQEGDYANACYWYAQAKKNASPKNADLCEEWELIVDTLLAKL